MAKVSTNISLDADLKRSSQELFSDLGMDLSTAVTIFLKQFHIFLFCNGNKITADFICLKQAVRVQGLPFPVSREIPNAETAAALNEYSAMKAHPENYPRYASFHDAMNEVLSNA